MEEPATSTRERGANWQNPSETHTNTDNHEKTKVAEVTICLTQGGKGPTAESKSTMVGPEPDKLDVRGILEKYGLEFMYAYNPIFGGACFPIQFDPENGRSRVSYEDGDVIYVHGDPKGPIVKPETIINTVAVAVIILLNILLWWGVSNCSCSRVCSHNCCCCDYE